MLENLFALQKHLDLIESSEPLQKKIQFWIYELETLVQPNLQALLRFEILRDFYFNKKSVQVSESATIHNLSFESLLKDKIAHPICVGAVLQNLARSIGLNLQFVQIGNHRILKFVHEGIPFYIDTTQKGRILENEQIIDVLAQSSFLPNFQDELNTLTPTQILIQYLSYLEACMISPVSLFKIYEKILSMNPLHLQSLAKLALLKNELGQKKEAFFDLKRFFSICEEDKQPHDLKKVFSDLRNNFGGSAEA